MSEEKEALSLDQATAAIEIALLHHNYEATKIKWSTLGFTLTSFEGFVLKDSGVDKIQKALPTSFQGVRVTAPGKYLSCRRAGQGELDVFCWRCDLSSVHFIWGNYDFSAYKLHLKCPSPAELRLRVARAAYTQVFKDSIHEALGVSMSTAKSTSS